MEPMLQLEGPWRHYVKWTKREENKYCEGSLICGIWKKKKPAQKKRSDLWLPGNGVGNGGGIGRKWS